ncbi:trypsin-like peptidase [Paraburkholderia sp. GV068]|uniref:AVAST type 1 anti-phage system protease Avs1b n=1 Tax=unclassified Paraburkholderia TaxID=2615204 RepID=UPI000D310546|nr:MULTISPECIES: AVAST type 1 anti-phage system protease Avs1b [unclassified Paraburkholderia]PTQ96496.1 trypsin-like peptidase [Paraburkholderia sp. GV072]PUB00768.1 trypsin-like peptidase [Paraburkholderia sp. GV068]
MTEDEIKQATCLVTGKNESGTGWLIKADLVLTAYHCVETAIRDGAPVTVRFGIGSSATELTVAVGQHDEDLDICLLHLSTPLSVEPIPINVDGLRPGEKWFAFGYPAAKLLLGHVVRGEIQQVLPERVHGVDLDLSIEPGTHLSDYHGFSGAPFMVGAACKGLLRLNVDSAIGGLSFSILKPFLRANGLLPDEPTDNDDPVSIGTRPAFNTLFESAISTKRGGYVFIEGSHGVGKSTYCQQFNPELPELDKLGVYQFTERVRGSTPAHQAQPEVFFDWANSLLSERATGKPARLMELSYSQLIQSTNEVLQSLANRCAKVGKVGVLFIDGINEAAAAGEETLKRFINLLPQEVPEGLVVAITGVGLDSIASSLGTLLQSAERLTLPTLDRDIQYGVCLGFLDKEKSTTEIVGTLCDRAMGHPLYLRYLADLVNSGATQGDIAELPVFSGSIQDYYETIWAKLVQNADVVNLLGILARLRWGIPTSNLTSMLTAAESGALPSTLLRVRHLLANPENTEIYHPSFSEFVVHKTASIDEWVHERLAGFCSSRGSGDYGILNKLYHGLRGGPESLLLAIPNCQQAWVDDSVLLGAEPDVLLADIDEALSAATSVGSAIDIIRLLLLSQRLTFRYNTLFVQSAELVALALISIGKTDDALRHVVRNGRLVVSADEAFAVANALTQKGSSEQALEVLELVQREINKVFEKMGSENGVGAQEFLSAVNHRLHAFSLAHAAGDAPSFTRFLRAITEGFLFRPNGNFSREEGSEILRQLTGEITGAQLCLQGGYRPFLSLGVPVDVDLRHQLLLFLQSLAHAEMYSEHYGIVLEREMVDLLLADIERAIDAPLLSEDRRFVFIDALIEAGARPGIVETYSVGVDMGDGALPFYEKNRAEPDEAIFESAMLRLRASSFRQDGYATPSVHMPTKNDWEKALEAIARAVAWCDGKGRRAMAIKDQSGLDAVWSFLADALLPCFAFNLESRIHWESSYFIPETVVPQLYRRVAKLVLDCFPTRAAVLLDAIGGSFEVQLGIYNEGFRQGLHEVLRLFIERRPEGVVADKVFSLALRYRDYVSANVENRFELVPELLQIVPLFAMLDAHEEALRTYKSMLSFSMGPSWYKEDQLSMMTSTLEALPATTPVDASSLAQIAGLLERATGEMTFQRFIRADKGNFIGQLCHRSFFLDAVRYFQHQTCGTLSELFAQATSGNLDRVSTFVGMRFPGAALEEQAALLPLLRHSREQASWQLRWALLEVYQHGDERHLTDWGQEYAAIISQLVDCPDDLERAMDRVRSIANSLNNERAWLLLRSFVLSLPSNLQPDFVRLRDEVMSNLDASQIERLTSSFGLSYEQDEAYKTPTPESDTNAPTDDVAEADAEDDRFFMPGTFGKRSTVRDARAQIDSARALLNRRNFSAATQECIRALQTLQAGGWSVWSNNHSGSDADRLIDAQVQNADELARLYGPLALEERHTQRWAVSSHLISLVGKKIDAAQQTALLAVAVDHVRQIVGDASPAPFAYIGSSAAGGASEALLELLLWTLDHPAWERRDSGAAMVLWVARTDGDWLSKLAGLAVSMDRRNRADIASATLDILSREDPAGLWLRIEPYIELAHVIEECRHVSRFTTFMRIVERASKRGVNSAVTAFRTLQERFPEDCPVSTPAPDKRPPNFVPLTLHKLWRDLSQLGLFTEGTLRTFAAQMVDSCQPLTVELAFELESLVAKGGREDSSLPTGRWASIVRYALNTALFQPMPASKLGNAEVVLRVYNPETLREPENGRDLLAGLVACVESGSERNYVPSHGNLVFLDFQCLMEIEHRTTDVELTSHLVPPGQSQPAPPTPPSFKATELPRPGPDEPIAICGRALPTIAYFGSVSPAIPTPRFLQLVRAQASKTVRYHWRDGGTVTSLASSRRHENTLLAIERDALALPEGWQMRWILRVNGKVRAVLHKL